MENFSYLPINWTQGMNVASSHFIATENFLLERLLKTTSLSYNHFYGILPKSNASYADIQVRNLGNSTHISLNSYSGICSGGYPLLIDEANNDNLSYVIEKSQEKTEEKWDIVLSVFPFQRVPAGVPDANELPLRFPYVKTPFQLGVLPYQERVEHAPFSVIVGVLKKTNAGYELDGNYIPPSLTMNAHESLKDYMHSFSKALFLIEESLKKILIKIQTQPNQTSITKSLFVLCKEMLRHLSSINFSWKNMMSNLSPFQVTEMLSSFAGAILTGLFFLSKKDKEEVLKYFHEWNGISPATFEQMLKDIHDNKYNHNRINLSMFVIDGMLQTLGELLTMLSQLEFVGQHKEGIVISERQMQSNTENNRWTVD